MSAFQLKPETVKALYYGISWAVAFVVSIAFPALNEPFLSAYNFEISAAVSGIVGWSLAYIAFRGSPGFREALFIVIVALAVYYVNGEYSSSFNEPENRSPSDETERLWLVYYSVSHFGLLFLLGSASKMGAEKTIQFFTNS